MPPSSPTASLDSAIAKSSQLSKIIWASSSSTHFAIKQLVGYAGRLNRALVRLRALPSAQNANRSTIEASNRKLDECVSFVDECISFRRDSVLTPGVAALSVDRNAFPAGRALLLSGELLTRVEQLEAFLRDYEDGGHTDSSPSTGPASIAPPHGTPKFDAAPESPDVRRSYTATVASLPVENDAGPSNSVPGFSMTDDYRQGVDVRTQYQLKRQFEASRHRTHAYQPPESLQAQRTPSIQPSSLGSTCSPSPGFSGSSISPSLHQSSITSYDSSIKAPSTTPAHKKLPSLSLGPAFLPDHVAVLRLFTNEGTQLPRNTQLSTWRKSSHADGSVITSSIQGSEDEFVHYLPFNAYPLTLHRDHNEGLVVQFNNLHKVALRSGNSERFFSATRVVYEFVQDEPFIDFQEDIRHKTLVEVFDFHQILSSRNGQSTYGEAIHGHVKIWKDREPPFQHSVSFFGNHARRDLEFPLLRFNSQPILKRPEKRVKLSFILPKKTSQNKGSFRGFFRRTPSSLEASTPIADQPPDIAELPSELAALMNDLKFLEFRFDTHEDFERFTKSFQEARAADEARPTFSLADLSAELENTSLASELPAERERAELEALLLASPTIRARAESESISPTATPRHYPMDLDAVTAHGRR